MDLLQSTVPLFLTILFIASFRYILVARSRSKLPPSPPAFPVIGHLHLLLERRKLPQQCLLQLSKKYGGLMFLRLGVVKTLVVSSPDAAREVFKVHDINFASRPQNSVSKYFGYEGLSLSWSPYGETWRNMRKLCTLELLTSKRVEFFEPIRKAEMLLLLDELLASSRGKLPVNLTAKFSDLTLNIMTRMVMNKSFSGSSSSSKEKQEALLFKDTLTAACGVASGIQIGDFIPFLSFLDTQKPRMKEFSELLDEYIQKEVELHRKQWKQGAAKDFIDVLLSQAEGTLQDDSDTTIKSLAMDMIVAGTDTAAEWALAELVNNPGALSKVQQELDRVVGEKSFLDESDIPKLGYLQAVVKETLRLHPTAPLLLPHESSQACKLTSSRYEVPAKTRLIVNAYAIGRDESYWKDPLKFDPDRFVGSPLDVRGHNFELLPFGAGRRMCPSMLLGLTMVHSMVGNLVHAFNWEVPGGTTLDMAEDFGMTMPRVVPLQLVPCPRLNTNKTC